MIPRLRLLFIATQVLSFAFVIQEPAFPQAPAPHPHPIVNTANVGILSVVPGAPVAGDTVTVTYSVYNVGYGSGSFTGYVDGSFLSQALVEPNGAAAPTITIEPRAEAITGTLLIRPANAGSGLLTVNFMPPLPAGCTGISRYSIRCNPKPLATTSIPLTVVEPTVHVRIAGSAYTQLSRPDGHDGSTINNGYQLVLHDPGCGWWGNSGTDKYFEQKALPANVNLEGVQFLQYWPVGIDTSGSGGDGLNSEGSYYAHLSSGNQVSASVRWNNTCQLSFGGKNLYYSVSFLVTMPKGTDLGEPTFDATSQPNWPPPPSGYSEMTQSAPPSSVGASGWAGQVQYCNPSTVSINEYLHIRAMLVTANANAQGSGSPMAEDNLPLQFSPGGVSGSESGFRTAQTYKQGTWKITDVYITTAPTSPPGATVQGAVHLVPVPGNTALPGSINSPVFNFTGGICQ